jgi:hypothetical protein
MKRIIPGALPVLLVLVLVGCNSVRPYASAPTPARPEAATPAEAAAAANQRAPGTAAPAATEAPTVPIVPAPATGPGQTVAAQTSAPATPAAAQAKASSARPATPAASRPPPAAKPAPPLAAAPAAAKAPAATTQAAAALDLAALEQRLRDTKAIGLFTKLSLKNQVDDLLEQFRAVYRGKANTPLTALRQRYDLLLFKVLSLLQDSDPPLAKAIGSSREAIWGILNDPAKLSAI